jgi:ribosomal protein S18 acetylase RimI-like enzyme
MARQVSGDGSPGEAPVFIRFAAEGDLNGILEIERLSFPTRKQWGYGDFRAALKDLFFVFLDGKPSGFLIGSCWEDTKRAVILRIAVHPDCRNRGIATRLIEAAIGKFREMGIREVEIDVEIVKRGAIQLYERVGFRTVRGIPMSENNTMNNENGSFYMMKMDIGDT